MREIKFRAWYHPEGYMLAGDELQTGLAGTLNEYFRDPDYRFMQYTGLRDKNGAEIYEGDIVRSREQLAQIRYSVLMCGFVAADLGDSNAYNDFPQPFNGRTGCEVIGNIYENPELLEGEQ